MLHRVELDGDLIAHGTPVDKHVGRRRRIIASIEATPVVREFSRWCALQVIHLWDALQIVREYLETGDESKREAAGEAAREAALEAAREAALEAAREAARAAAWAAALEAARKAAWAAALAAALAAAWEAALEAAREAQRVKFAEMVETAFRGRK
jgi:hypothetical protein